MFIRTKHNMQNFGCNLLYQATVQHLNNSKTVKNDEKCDGELRHLPASG